MAENGYASVAAVPGHIGRIPNYGKSQVNPMGSIEPPACIQNAMMTKDKKPFTYTPGGLDLSQIKCPSMARRMARQRSLEEQEQAYGHQQPNGAMYHPQGGPAPPPPPPQAPAPPPPPPLVIPVPKSKSPNPIVPGERPEIVIPENPIGMLRKTNSPYHWESEKADMERLGPIPKFVEKVPSPLTVQMPPSNFSQQPQQNHNQQNNVQRQNFSNSNQSPHGSPLHKPEAQYANHATPLSNSPMSPKEHLHYNNSPYSNQSPVSNGSIYSPSPNTTWKQPERRDSPANQSPQAQMQFNRSPLSPTMQQSQPSYQLSSSPAYHTLPRAATKAPEPQYNNTIYNNVNQGRPQSPRPDTNTPWRSNIQNKPQESEQSIFHNSHPVNQQPTYTPPWKVQSPNNNSHNEQQIPPNKPEPRNIGNQAQNQAPYVPPWVANDANNNKNRETFTPPWLATQEKKAPTTPPAHPNQTQEPRYQSTMSLPINQRNVQPRPDQGQPQSRKPQSPQREVVYVNQEPVYYCPDSPKVNPGWAKTQKEKTPPPEWCQRTLERGPRDIYSPPRETYNQEPEWVKKSNEMQRNVRDVMSPPRYQQPVQPTWSTKPSDNKKNTPEENGPGPNGCRFIPVKTENSNSEPVRHVNQLRITVGVPEQPTSQGSYSQPTQRIMRVLSPHTVRIDDAVLQPDLPTLNRSFQNQSIQNQNYHNQSTQNQNYQNQSYQNQSFQTQTEHRTRIIPIQIEGGNDGRNQSYGGRY